MQLITTENKLAGSKKALEIIEKGITSGEVNTLGLATGSTPETLYAELVKSDVDTKNVTTTNLDEYVGLAANDPNSYHYYMNELLFSKKAFKESFLPNGEAADAEAECARYEEILSEHPIDIQVLGIGTNGHIGFNEPGTSFDSLTHKVVLTDSTREANKRFFEREEDVPTHAYSMGIKSIMNAKKIILLAFGENKAQAIKETIKGPVDVNCPASVLQNHPDVTVILDNEAASLL
ncbi:glucosamine-6-phosphate deaminase [Listeria monocytogenes]|uniref:glucosamine-6-phosphate deaminase n=1 Tax=Listeria monocytogenes TaxID=1639 RepID=UPI0010B61A28|nr:glucosamine-6-phosphate deaminase [Listeria monocytogenes]EAC9889184.1 glucosamine-6-phosphate deaminase [Listeria monocytogenes]EAE3614872.1 glucosamine-6-phosphate deaminase [Listeria monocytogenes]EAE3652602.1 glucosamine-6-phosphate deaminase [Listeria monocytogenes]EAE5988945.1 glucosamine-6-phosphate deaminase [Listeria monocytogenes]EAE6016226.1 glucosamine-6-phosphate deaminase [Listeria monocytogenes]